MDEIYKHEFDHHSVKAIIVALNRWFGSEGKMPVKYFDAFIGYYDFCIDEPYVDNGAHLDFRPRRYYNGSTWDSNTDCPNRPKNAAYAAIEYLREEHGIFYSPQMEPDNTHKTKGELTEQTRADYWFKAARERLEEIEKLRKEIKRQTKDDMDYILSAFRNILDALGIDKSEYVHMDIPSLTRFAIMEAEKAGRNLDNYRGGAVKFAADYSALQKEKEDLEKRIKTLVDSNNLLGRDYLEANAARNRLELEKERLKKDNSKLRIRCDSVFGAGGFVTKAMINDLCDEYTVVRPGDDEDCKASLRYILDILKEYRDKTVFWEEKIYDMSRAAACLNCRIKDLYKFIFDSAPQNMDDEEMLERIKKAYGNTFDRARGAGQTYKLICDICDKYEIKKPSSDLTLEESIDDIIKRFKMTLKENQDFRYNVEKLYCNMTDQVPSKYMTILGILRAIAEDVDDREAEYSYMEEKYSVAEKLRKDWVRRYESEHERANGEHKKADKYWAQVAGLQTRVKNLEDALNNAASNATGYEALKNTLRKSLCNEESLKKELDICRQQLKAANDAIRANNERVLGHERLDDLDGASGDTTSGQGT